MPAGGRPLLIAWGLLVLTGCASGGETACRQERDDRSAVLDRDHAARVAATEEESAQIRTPGEKGPTPEGIEAIALVEKQILDSRRKECAPPRP